MSTDQPKGDNLAAVESGNGDTADPKDPKANKGTIHPYDPTTFDPEEDGDEGATWNEVCRTCCCHSPAVWAVIIVKLIFVILALYIFCIGLEILSTGSKVFTGCVAGKLFSDDMNPIAALMIGTFCLLCHVPSL